MAPWLRLWSDLRSLNEWHLVGIASSVSIAPIVEYISDLSLIITSGCSCHLLFLISLFHFCLQLFCCNWVFTIFFTNHVFYVWRFSGTDLLGRLKKNSYHPRSLVFGDFRFWNRLVFEKHFFLPGHILVMFQRKIFMLIVNLLLLMDL